MPTATLRPAPTPSAPSVPPSEQNLRFILGLKLNQLRKQQALSLKELAGRAGIAISYLNESEKGKKSVPQSAKLLDVDEEETIPSSTSTKLLVASGRLVC